jgi:hypothetical protein
MKRKFNLGAFGVVSIFALTALYGVISANAQKTGRLNQIRNQGNAINQPQSNPTSPIMADDFTFSVGSLLTADGWAITGTSVVNPQTVTTGNLTYTGWPSAGGGNSVTLADNGQDTNKSIAPQTSGTVYAGLLVNVPTGQTTGTTGDYFFHFFVNSTTFYGKVFLKKDTASSNYAFGVSKNANATTGAVFSGFTYTPGTTHLVIVKYTFNPSATDDTVALFVDPTLPGAEPAATLLCCRRIAPRNYGSRGSCTGRRGPSRQILGWVDRSLFANSRCR